MDQTTRLDSTGLEHQHWIAAARGIIETLTLDPMTGIFCPFVSCLLHTKTGQHSVPPLYMISGTPPRFTQLSWWSPAIDPHFTPTWQGCMIANPNEIFPNLQEEPSIHPRNEVNALLHPYWRNAWLQNPDEIFPNLQKELCIHPPR